MGESSSTIVELSPMGAGTGLEGRKNSESPDSFRSITVGIVIPPAGPKVADLRLDSIWGDEVECLSARCSIIGATVGEVGTSRVARVTRSDEFVFRLSWLGFLFMAGILGLMNEGEDGSETRELDIELKGGWIERPFMFLGRLGAGDVIGRSVLAVSATVSEAIEAKPPKDMPGNEDNGGRFTGESGDEDGEGSDSEEESVQDRVVVGDDSADSEFCVEVLSLCL